MVKEILQRPTWAIIDLDNLAFNFRSVKAFIGDTVKYMAVVKANAYGHGAVACAERFVKEGVDWLGVALPEEASELRQAGISIPILCLGGFWPEQEDRLIDQAITPVIFQLDRADRLNVAAARRGVVANVHIKIDTGMGRLGVPFSEVSDFAESLAQFRNLRVAGLMTHFAAADRPEENEFTSHQIQVFNEACAIFQGKGHSPDYFDMANSPASVALPKARGNMVRLGGILYGLGGDVLPANIDKPELRPVMTVVSRIAFIKKVPPGNSLGYGRTFKTTRESLIASVPIGYHDGYRRALSNKCQVLINGRLAPVAGRISMDWTLVDVTDIEGVKEGDEVVLFGTVGGHGIRAEDLAAACGTISYEITCGIHQRVRRQYFPE